MNLEDDWHDLDGRHISRGPKPKQPTAPEQMTAEERQQFPIMIDSWKRAHLPWELFEPHEAQAQRNHYQSLTRLAERGGLSPAEALAVLEDRKFQDMDDKDAWIGLIQIAEQAAASRARAETLEEAAQVAEQAADAEHGKLKLKWPKSARNAAHAIAAAIRELAVGEG